ncbi:MAG TPA: hypothetical protein VIQ02_03180 [Jiangellaceae bacterium]
MARLSRRIAMISVLALAVGLGTHPVAQAASGGTSLEPIGDPIWKPVDCHVFSAPVGTAETGYAEAFETFASLLPPPNHVAHPDLGIGPGVPHQPPYDSELATGLAGQPYREANRFRTSEFSDGAGVFLVCMVVPKPGSTGSSPDFASGPIIPNSVFPIQVTGVAYRGGSEFDPFLANFQVPPLTAELDPPFDVDGHSHFPIFVATNADFGPEGQRLPGRYRYDLTLADADGNGWRVKAQFVVTP